MRRFGSDDFAWAAEHGVVCCCWSATANGYLARGGEVPSFDNPISRARLAAATALGEAKGVTAQQIGLAWLMAQPGDVRPIVGTTNLAHLAEAVGARGVVLSDSERDALAVEVP